MDEDNWLTFPDEPRVELDRVISDLIERARSVVDTQGRLRALLRANIAVSQQLELPKVLQEIVDAAVILLGADYGALGVNAPHGGLEQFIHVGMSPAEVESIGHLPEGHGLLGALIDDPRPIRLEHVSDDRRSSGFPAAHPAMEGFLSVPVRVRDEVFGNLYLTNRTSGGFSLEDEQLAIALAATAGNAIDNARLYAETQSRQSWSAAATEIVSTLLSGDPGDALAILTSRVQRLSAADFVCVIQSSADDGEGGTITSPVGRTNVTETGQAEEIKLAAVSALEAWQPRVLETEGDQDHVDKAARFGPVLFIPIVAVASTRGVLVVARLADGAPYTPFDLEIVSDFAAQASVAMELAETRADSQRLAQLEDRARIARDLHDHVIQQLFATGLSLQSLLPRVEAGASAARLQQSIDNVDVAIAQIRTAIFAISGTHDKDGVRSQILEIVHDLSAEFAQTPQIVFDGPVDLVITEGLADDVIAVVRESLINVVKHSRAQTISVEVVAGAETIDVRVRDDGVGIPRSGRRSGLANLRKRAEHREGAFTVSSAPGSTQLLWSVPYRQSSTVLP